MLGESWGGGAVRREKRGRIFGRRWIGRIGRAGTRTGIRETEHNTEAAGMKITSIDQCKTGMRVRAMIGKERHPVEGILHRARREVWICHYDNTASGIRSPNMHGRPYSWWLGWLGCGSLPYDLETLDDVPAAPVPPPAPKREPVIVSVTWGEDDYGHSDINGEQVADLHKRMLALRRQLRRHASLVRRGAFKVEVA